MSEHINKIVEKLPKGLSETGIKEVASLLDEVVDERVAEEVKLLETKVKAFIRAKITDLKEAALRELQADNDLARSYKVFETIKTLVASEIESSDVDSVVKTYEADNSKLQSEIEALTEQLDNSVNTVTILESKMGNQKRKLSRLTEALEEQKEMVEIPFKSSESAVMITNESHGDLGLPDSARENYFLNEDVIRLSQLPEKEKNYVR